VSRWLIATFTPVSLFSLRTAYGTSKGGKTLLLPTPYAVKMALLDACFRCNQPSNAAVEAEKTLRSLKAAAIRLLPPDHCVVNHTFLKILDRDRDSDSPFKQTIAYREFVAFTGDLHIAIGCAAWNQDELDAISALIPHLNTFGKRGSFWQFTDLRLSLDPLPDSYTVLRSEAAPTQILPHITTQPLDEFGDALINAKDAFNRLSTYGDGKVELNKHRVLSLTAVPYRRRAAGQAFTWYERTT
jgi:hypothetical protein